MAAKLYTAGSLLFIFGPPRSIRRETSAICINFGLMRDRRIFNFGWREPTRTAAWINQKYFSGFSATAVLLYYGWFSAWLGESMMCEQGGLFESYCFLLLLLYWTSRYNRWYGAPIFQSSLIPYIIYRYIYRRRLSCKILSNRGEYKGAIYIERLFKLWMEKRRAPTGSNRISGEFYAPRLFHPVHEKRRQNRIAARGRWGKRI